ncbi:autotransporter outer membrane beta-barrel domain-containing protein [Martelella alba]|nr:autotransporter outer membrane beta-barrel domain-containing protein [Martelella alba]
MRFNRRLFYLRAVILTTIIGSATALAVGPESGIPSGARRAMMPASYFAPLFAVRPPGTPPAAAANQNAASSAATSGTGSPPAKVPVAAPPRESTSRAAEPAASPSPAIATPRAADLVASPSPAIATFQVAESAAPPSPAIVTPRAAELAAPPSSDNAAFQVAESAAPPSSDNATSRAAEPAAPPSSGTHNDDAAGTQREPVRSSWSAAAAGIHINQLIVANSLFTTHMQDRHGAWRINFPPETRDDNASPLWLRTTAEGYSASLANGRAKTTTRDMLLQGGGEVARLRAGDNGSWHLGVMAGIGQGRSKSRDNRTGDSAHGRLHGYSGGIYATWFGDEQNQLGPYFDGSVNYNVFHSHVRSNGRHEQRYSLRGLTGAIAGGYTMLAYSGENRDLLIQPQTQLTWLGVRPTGDGGRESHSAALSGERIQTRLGARASLQTPSSRNRPVQSGFQPFLELNYLRNPSAYDFHHDGRRFQQSGQRHQGEIRIGHAGRLTQNIHLAADLGHRFGQQGFKGYHGSLGLKIEL